MATFTGTESLTSAALEAAKPALLAILDDPGDAVLIDMTTVALIDSAGLALLAAFLTGMQERHPTVGVTIQGLSGLPAKVFAMTRLADALPMVSIE